jgi:hypothetical protein
LHELHWLAGGCVARYELEADVSTCDTGGKPMRGMTTVGVLARGAVCLVLLIAAVNCATIPSVPAVEQAQLEDHVAYLAQPALKGRKPLSRGSRLARQYIMAHFEAAGLRPWGATEGFEQRVHIGTNVIGVLPGADPVLAKEIVLVSAHYDHIGRGRLGASDNAAGVAAMLALLERFAANPPRRSICFAAFDCEERGLFGSFAFTLREDFDPGSLVAVVNVDMLGRDFLEVVERSLIVSGTHGYPATRRVAAEACAAHGMQFMPLAPDLIGPRSDHVAFQAFDVPCIFFTCGVFDGYHTAEDTAARVDYGTLADSTQVVYEVVAAFANEETVEQYAPPSGPDPGELAAIAATLAALNANAAGLELSAETQQTIQTFLVETIAPHLDEAAGASYTFETRDQIAESLIRVLGPDVGHLVLGASDRETPDLRQLSVQWALSRVFAQRPGLFVRAYGGFVAHVLEHRPVPALRPLPPYAFEETVDQDPWVIVHDDGSREFVHNPLTIKVDTRMKRYNRRPHGRATFTLAPRYFHGSHDELIDYLYLGWLLADEDARGVWGAALAKAGAIADGADVEVARLAWLRDVQCANSEAWTLRTLSSGNPWLAHTCIALLRARPELQTGPALASIRDLAEDTAAPPWLRKAAIAAYSTLDDENAADTLAALSADTTPIEPIYRGLAFDTSRALYHHESSAFLRAAYAETPEKPYDTIGEVAQKRLKELRHRP